MSSALWLDPATLAPGASPAAPRPRSNRVDDVQFPSRKVMLFEQIAYCTATDGEFDWINVIGQTFRFPGSVSTIDGAVRRARQIDGLPARGTLPFEWTTHGIRGVDLP